MALEVDILFAVKDVSLGILELFLDVGLEGVGVVVLHDLVIYYKIGMGEYA